MACLFISFPCVIILIIFNRKINCIDSYLYASICKFPYKRGQSTEAFTSSVPFLLKSVSSIHYVTVLTSDCSTHWVGYVHHIFKFCTAPYKEQCEKRQTTWKAPLWVRHKEGRVWDTVDSLSPHLTQETPWVLRAAAMQNSWTWYGSRGCGYTAWTQLCLALTPVTWRGTEQAHMVKGKRSGGKKTGLF